MKNITLIVLLLTIVFSGCNIQKRKHLKGFHVQWKKNHPKNDPKEEKEIAYQPAYKSVAETRATTMESEVAAQKTSTFDSETKSKSNNQRNTILRELKTTHESVEELTRSKPTSSSNKNNDKGAEKGSIKSSSNPDKQGDYPLYLTAALMAAGVIGGIAISRKKVNRLSAWAAKNPKKTQVLIAGIQVPLIAGALYSGYNLHKMGYDISETANYVFGGVMLAGYLATPFIQRKGELVLRKKLNRRRLAFLGISLSSAMLITNIGNNAPQSGSFAFIGNTLEKVDNAFFPSPTESSFEANQNVQSEIKSATVESSEHGKRTAANAWMIALGILLFILLIVTACAGICLIGFGVMDGNIGVIAGGALLLALSIWGMIAIVNGLWNKS